MASKYLKNSEGIVRAITSDNLQLEKPLLNENYDIEVHNRNMDKIDSAIQEVKGKVDGLELTAQRVSIADPTNKFEATNVEDALLENKTSILNLQTKVDNGQNHKLCEDNGTVILLNQGYDLNNLKNTGMYNGSSLVNAPNDGWWYIEVMQHTNLNGFAYQRLTSLSDFNNIIKYERQLVGGTWGAWRPL